MARIKATRDAWISLGLDAFSEDGIKALIIERLAAQLGCTKAGFYWYFGNREEFIAAILDRWLAECTHGFIAVPTAPVKLADFTRTIYRSRKYVDFLFHLRKFALSNEKAAGILQQAETTRLKTIASLLKQEGLSAASAKQLAKFLYHQYLGWFERYKYHVSAGEIDRQVKFVLALVQCFRSRNTQ